MDKILIFERDLYQGSLPMDFYKYCLRYQIGLIRYIPFLLITQLLYLCRCISKKEFLERKWSYLQQVKDLDKRIQAFEKTKGMRDARKRYQKLKNKESLHIISEHPQEILKSFHIEEAEGVLYFSRRSRILKKIGRALFLFFVLTMLGIYLGVASLYFAGCFWGTELAMVKSYFHIRIIAVLNIIPVILLVYIIYFIVDRVWLTTALSSAITLGLTWVNYYKLQFRSDPLVFEELTLIAESKEMAGKYSIVLLREMKITIVLVLILVVAAAVLIKKRRNGLLKRSLFAVLLLVVFCQGVSTVYSDPDVYAKAENNDLINQWSEAQLFLSRGFVYPFLNSVQYSRLEKPEGYSKKQVEKEFKAYGYSDIPENKKVNVIGIMLEAYNDFSKYPQIEYNVDVYEELHNIQKEAYSGELVTNIFAGGTVNTERAFLSGFTEQPMFRKNTNTYARYFGEQGYTVEGSHPCYAWFYNRQNVNKNLGFENYYFYENQYAELADNKIAADDILFPDIIKKYEENKATGKPYFNFSVTYQNHGPYSLENEQEIEYVKKNPEYTEESYAILNNYSAGIYKTTQELKKMIDYFSAEEEPVVLIVFGDHNPWLGDGNSVYNELEVNFDMGTEEGFYNYFNTPYFIWGNAEAKAALGNELKGEGPRIGPYFLMSKFFELAGYEGNEFAKITRELTENIDVVHKVYYKEDGRLTQELTPENQEKLNQYLRFQYYWIKNYKEDK